MALTTGKPGIYTSDIDVSFKTVELLLVIHFVCAKLVALIVHMAKIFITLFINTTYCKSYSSEQCFIYGNSTIGFHQSL